MHVLLLPSWYPSDSASVRGVFFREQAIALRDGGFDVGVLSLSFFSPKKIFSCGLKLGPFDYENDCGVHSYRKEVINLSLGFSGVLIAQWVSHGLRCFEAYIKERGRPDVIHVHSLLYAGFLALEIRKRYGVPYVVTEHSTAFSRGIVTTFLRRKMFEVVLGAKVRLAVSKPFALLLNDFFSLEKCKWEVLPNMVSKRFFECDVFDQDESCFSFVNVSMHTDKKGVDLIIRAFSKAFKGESSVSLVLGGDGERRNELEALSVRLGVSSQVQFLGVLSRAEVVDEMLKARVFVLGSYYETFGVVVAESLALGKPVVSTRCGGPEGFIRQEDGLLVSVDDVNAMADAMSMMHKNYQSYDSDEIRASCKVRFGEDRVVRELRGVYAREY